MASTSDVLLVTGGSRGIGAAIVRRASALGYAVAFSYVQDEASARALEAELRAEGRHVHAMRGDVSDETFAAAFFEEAETALGQASALVNNAGITGRIGPFAEADPEILRRTLDVNVLGTMFTAQEAVRRWAKRGVAGRIVNISSVAATTGSPHEYVHYAASKAAVDAFTVGLAKEVAPSGTRVNAVAPGTTYTDIHAAGGEPGRPARVVSRVPLGRIGETEEIAHATLWLLSPEASYVTGAVLPVSGGI